MFKATELYVNTSGFFNAEDVLMFRAVDCQLIPDTLVHDYGFKGPTVARSQMA